MCSSPHERLTPRPNRPYRLPMNTPDSADWASRFALGNVIPAAAKRGAAACRAHCGAQLAARRAASLHLQCGAWRGELLGIHRDPAAVLNLLYPHQVVAVVAGA